MSSRDGENLVFGRYTREECGLPPRGRESWRQTITPLRVLMLFAVTAAAAWLGGQAMARWRAHWLATLPVQVHNAEIADIPALLEQGRLYATAIPGDQRMRRDLALAAVTAAERMPRRLGYYSTAAGLFRGLEMKEIPPGLERFGTEMAAAGVYEQIGDYPDAFAALDRANAELAAMPEDAGRAYRLLLMNAQAYFLASAPEDKGGDPEKALELARLVASSRDALPGGGHASGNAAILDTMAAAWNRMGADEQAVATQSLALGLADGAGLDIYLRHYDEFNKGIRHEEE